MAIGLQLWLLRHISACRTSCQAVCPLDKLTAAELIAAAVGVPRFDWWGSELLPGSCDAIYRKQWGS